MNETENINLDRGLKSDRKKKLIGLFMLHSCVDICQVFLDSAALFQVADAHSWKGVLTRAPLW